MEFHGVYPLAESQLDRFTAHLLFTTPDIQAELEIYTHGLTPHTQAQQPVVNLKTLTEIQTACDRIHVDPSVIQYVQNLVQKTRESPEVQTGVSIRGGLQLIQISRGLALVRNRNFVTPQDVADLATHVLSHRLRLVQTSYEIDPLDKKRSIVAEIVDQVKRPT